MSLILKLVKIYSVEELMLWIEENLFIHFDIKSIIVPSMFFCE